MFFWQLYKNFKGVTFQIPNYRQSKDKADESLHVSIDRHLVIQIYNASVLCHIVHFEFSWRVYKQYLLYSVNYVFTPNP